jgi:hypothetical protein
MKQINLAEVQLFLSALRSQDASWCPGLDPDDCAKNIITEIFSKGNCGNLAIMLALAFDAQPVCLTNNCHILSRINGRLFDITGDVTDMYCGYAAKDLSLVELMESDMVNNYSYAQRGPIL